jgi:hypothetical protein
MLVTKEKADDRLSRGTMRAARPVDVTTGRPRRSAPEPRPFEQSSDAVIPVSNVFS